MPTAATTTASSDQNRLKLPTRLHDEANLKTGITVESSLKTEARTSTKLTDLG
jgi:hypothetical protein